MLPTEPVQQSVLQGSDWVKEQVPHVIVVVSAKAHSWIGDFRALPAEIL